MPPKSIAASNGSTLSSVQPHISHPEDVSLQLLDTLLQPGFDTRSLSGLAPALPFLTLSSLLRVQLHSQGLAP